MSTGSKPLGVSLGDVRGIGPELVVRCLAKGTLPMDSVIFGPREALVAAVHRFAPHMDPERLVSVDTGWQCPTHLLPKVKQCSKQNHRQKADFFQKMSLEARCSTDEHAGAAAAAAVSGVARAALRGEISAVVTAPLAKTGLSAAGLAFPGHTELLQFEAALHAGVAVESMPVRMMLANAELRSVLVSIHVSLRDAIAQVTTANVLQTIQIADAALRQSLGRAPRLAIAGLNPHAGEDGLLGREEIEQIAPAIAQAQAQGIQASGPYPPDTIFMRARRKPEDSVAEFDAVIAMTHDHGLIPIKYLGLDEGVNVTLGLPLIRTSPDHGTAFDLAWQGKARLRSFERAVEVALPRR